MLLLFFIFIILVGGATLWVLPYAIWFVIIFFGGSILIGLIKNSYRKQVLKEREEMQQRSFDTENERRMNQWDDYNSNEKY